jgi:hypothetical protein
VPKKPPPAERESSGKRMKDESGASRPLTSGF